jgi:hypothetical protein
VRSLILLVLAGLLPLMSAASDVYRWKDEQGRVHYGNKVPEQYRQGATLMAPEKKDEGEGQRRRDAERDAARDRAEYEAAKKARASKPAEPAKPVARSAAATAPPANDCQARLKRYQDSQACFAPFFNANGSIRPEAFAKCTEVKEPSDCHAQALPAPPRSYGEALPR